ncbi:MAG: hypothetical protein ACRDOS_12435 [Gaiellaceae bacterium]|jgi:hypothetical protein
MSEPELARRRRCRALQLAIALGIFLPILQPSWITLGSAVAGIAVLAFVYRRECRHETEDDSAH